MASLARLDYQRLTGIRLPRLVWLVLEATAWALLLVITWAMPGDMRDTGAYYNVALNDIYASSTFLSTGYVYSPVFAVVTEPLRWLPIEVMERLIQTTSAIALGWLVTPFVGLAMILIDYPGIRIELGIGNIDLLITVALVFVLFKPWVWPALLLTKVAPGVGLMWHVARREWGAIGVALGLTVLLAVLSLPFVGIGAWFEWWSVLTGENIAIADSFTGWPLFPRLVAGAVLAGMAGLAGWPWVIPVAVAISFADPNVGHWLVILAIPRLWIAHRRNQWATIASPTAS